MVRFNGETCLEIACFSSKSWLQNSSSHILISRRIIYSPAPNRSGLYSAAPQPARLILTPPQLIRLILTPVLPSLYGLYLPPSPHPKRGLSLGSQEALLLGGGGSATCSPFGGCQEHHEGCVTWDLFNSKMGTVDM